MPHSPGLAAIAQNTHNYTLLGRTIVAPTSRPGADKPK